jgi:hypothetical protein
MERNSPYGVLRDNCVPRLRHRPVEAPRLGQSAHGNHRSKDVDALLALAAWAVWCEEKSCSKHEIAAQKKAIEISVG